MVDDLCDRLAAVAAELTRLTADAADAGGPGTREQRLLRLDHLSATCAARTPPTTTHQAMSARTGLDRLGDHRDFPWSRRISSIESAWTRRRVMQPYGARLMTPWRRCGSPRPWSARRSTRVTHAYLVGGTSPLSLAARADVALKLVGDDLGPHVCDLLE